MAKLRKNSFVFPSGKLNGVVYKVWKGIPYMSSEPVFTKPITSPAVLESNSKFKLFGALTSQLNSDPKIKTIWEKSQVKGRTVRNQIMHVNYSRVDESRDFRNLVLVPFKTLFPAELLNGVNVHNILTLTFAPFPVTHAEKFYPIISAHGILHFYNSETTDNKKYHMIEKVSSTVVPYKKGETHTFNIEWDSDSNVSQGFNQKQFCLTLILEDRDGTAAACSENVVVEMAENKIL